MIPEVAWSLVPEALPADIEPWELIAVDETVLNGRQMRAYLWAHSLLRATRAAEILPALENYLRERGNARIADVSAGFIPFGDVEDATRSGVRQSIFQRTWKLGAPSPRAIWAFDGSDRWMFGVVIGVEFPSDVPSGESSRPVDLSSFNRIFTGPGPAFPVIVERREILRDKPSNPLGSATSACYVRTRAGKRYYSGARYTDGILIARHVLVPSYTTPGVSVPMATTPPSAVVGDIDSGTTIDAAVLDTGAGSVPAGAKPLSLVTAVGIGLRVKVDGSKTQFSADILRVMDDPNYFGNKATHIAFIDAYGKSGDSGALVTGPKGDAVGLYIARTAAPFEGIVQLMRQVTTYFEIDLYL